MHERWFLFVAYHQHQSTFWESIRKWNRFILWSCAANAHRPTDPVSGDTAPDQVTKTHLCSYLQIPKASTEHTRIIAHAHRRSRCTAAGQTLFISSCLIFFIVTIETAQMNVEAHVMVLSLQRLAIYKRLVRVKWNQRWRWGIDKPFSPPEMIS